MVCICAYIAFLNQTLSLHIPSSTKNIKISPIKLFSTPTNHILHLKSQIKMPHTVPSLKVGKSLLGIISFHLEEQRKKKKREGERAAVS